MHNPLNIYKILSVYTTLTVENSYDENLILVP
jgi:hypothetical protein